SEEEVMARVGTETTRVISISSLGEPATSGSADVAGSTEPDDCGAEPGDRATSRGVSRSTAVDDASPRGAADRFGLPAHHPARRPVPLRQADCELSGIGATGGVERQSATPGTYHKTGEFDVALLAGGSSPGYGAQPSGMAQPVLPSDDAAGAEDRQGRHGTE